MRVTALVMTAMMAMPAARAETLLRLAEAGRVQAKPDELVATLRAQAQAPSAVAAQNAVNAAMAKALAAAKGVAGIVVSTGGYQVWQAGQPSPHWQAGQSLTARGMDGAAVLGLVGTLQGQGLAVQGLAWQLKSETAEHARDEATFKALGALRARAEKAAKVLGLTFDSFREVRMDVGAIPPRPMPMLMGAAAAAPMAPPQAEAGDVDVTATVEATVVLK